jgi:phenylalanyl-tRNA synthetase beta chain
MKITLSWIKDYLETTATLDQIVDQLNMLGLVVDHVIDHSKGLEAFTIAQVISAEKHPDADRLNVCQVDTGKEKLQIVCGGVNVHDGMKVVLAPIDSVIPTNGMKIRLSQIRGVESQGMLCSPMELGVEYECLEGGIIDLPKDAPIGTKFTDYVGLSDPVLDIEITPNRGDCLGAYGIARDLAATGIGTFKSIQIPDVKGVYENPIKVVISEESQDVCTLFTGVYIRGVKNGPSPAWMQQRLRAVGLRPISALVDITNYMSQSIGRPMHVFDADTLNGNLLLRQARKGEKILALNDVEYEMDESMTVVADQTTAQAVGGIIGGSSSGCTYETRNVFMECAVFQPIPITLTGRKLNIITDARHRFERGVDAAMIPVAQKIATQFIIDHCGGEASEMFSVGQPPQEMPIISFRPKRVKEMIGVDVPAEKSHKILGSLGLSVQGDGDTWKVKVPTWRHDLTLEEDLVEEVIRVYGYDHIPTTALPPVSADDTYESYPGSRTRQKWGWQIRRALCAQGLNEAITMSFLDEKTAQMFGGGNPALKLINPISSELSDMRPSLLPNLIHAVQRNFDRDQHNVNLYEVGKQFSDIGEQGEMLVASGVRSGKSGPRHWEGQLRDVDTFDAKADAITALKACGIDTENLMVLTPGPAYFHPGRSGYLSLGPKNKIAAFGEMHPKALGDMKVDPKVVGFEVYISNLPIPKNNQKTSLELSPYQPVERDFAFIVDRSTPAQDVISAVKKVDKELISDIRLFDVFEGKTIEDGKKSLGISVRIEPKEGTMTDEMLSALSNKIIEQVRTLTGGELRT